MEERYSTGVWYDTDYDAFCTLSEADNGEVQIHDLDGDIVDTVGENVWEEVLKEYFVKVDQSAVDDPVATVERATRILQRNDINELSGYPQDEAFALKYAMTQVEIVEKE